jgi:Ca2+-binding EF-hand superfamily protein
MFIHRINLDYMKEQLDTFAVIDTDKDGIITLEDLVKYHDLPTCTSLKLLFSAFDPVSHASTVSII